MKKSDYKQNKKTWNKHFYTKFGGASLCDSRKSIKKNYCIKDVTPSPRLHKNMEQTHLYKSGGLVAAKH